MNRCNGASWFLDVFEVMQEDHPRSEYVACRRWKMKPNQQWVVDLSEESISILKDDIVKFQLKLSRQRIPKELTTPLET